jgi:hypothetical protein
MSEEEIGAYTINRFASLMEREREKERNRDIIRPAYLNGLLYANSRAIPTSAPTSSRPTHIPLSSC